MFLCIVFASTVVYHACIAPWFLKAVVHVRQCHSAWLLSVGTKTILDSPFASPAPLPPTFSFLDIWPRNDFLTKQEKTLIKHCQRHNGPKALRTLNQSTPFFKAEAFTILAKIQLGFVWQWARNGSVRVTYKARQWLNLGLIKIHKQSLIHLQKIVQIHLKAAHHDTLLPQTEFHLPLPCVKLLPTSCQTVKWQGLAAKLGIP